MTGKEFKRIAALIPDDATVDLGVCDNKQGTFTPSELITGATVMTQVKFSGDDFVEYLMESTVIFDAEGGKSNGCDNQ